MTLLFAKWLSLEQTIFYPACPECDPSNSVKVPMVFFCPDSYVIKTKYLFLFLFLFDSNGKCVYAESKCQRMLNVTNMPLHKYVYNKVYIKMSV